MISSNFPFITDGIVKDVDDPQQNGRLKIWCPALDGEHLDIDRIPWAEYASPFAGVTNNFKSGRNKTQQSGPKAYGFWALPKLGAQVLVFLLNGDPNRRFYFASYYGMHRNRSLPGGRNKNESGAPGPWTDSYDPMQPAYDNLRVAFQNQMTAPQTRSRGVLERQAAQDKTDKDGADGYAKDIVDGKYLDPQTYCLTTPGGHFMVLDDAADNCRIRLRTTEGNQVIIDDTNERIYVSTAKGKTWIELDEDGHIHVFGSESISLRAGKDVNVYADRDFNVEAGRNINMKTVTGEIKISAEADMSLRTSAGTIYQTACGDMHIAVSKNLYTYAEKDINTKSEQGIYQESVKYDASAKTLKLKSDTTEIDGGSKMDFGASVIITHQNSGSSTSYSRFSSASSAEEADAAPPATSPSVVPGHEPWKRPASAKQRNKYWSE